MRRSTLPGACLHAARLGALRSVAGAAIAPRRRSACAGLRGARLGGIITVVGGLGPRPVSHGEFWHAHAGRSACDAGLRRHHRMIGGCSSDRALGSGPRVDDWRARRCESLVLSAAGLNEHESKWCCSDYSTWCQGRVQCSVQGLPN